MQLFETDAVEKDLSVVVGVHDLAEVHPERDLVVEFVDIEDLPDGGRLQDAVFPDGLEETAVGYGELLAVEPVEFLFLDDIPGLRVLHLLDLEGIVDVGGEGSRLHAGVQLVGQGAVLLLQALNLPFQLPVLFQFLDQLLLALHQVVLEPVVEGPEGEEGQDEGDDVGQHDGHPRHQAREKQEKGDVASDQEETRRNPEGVPDFIPAHFPFLSTFRIVALIRWTELWASGDSWEVILMALPPALRASSLAREMTFS